MPHPIDYLYHRYDVWREGRFVDLWSVVHVYSGMVAGLFPLFVPVGFATALIMAVLAFVIWEVLERYSGLATEHLTNQTTDVLFGTLGFLLTYPLLSLFSEPVLWTIFGSLWLATILIASLGWRAGARAKLIRARILSSRDRLVAIRRAWRLRFTGWLTYRERFLASRRARRFVRPRFSRQWKQFGYRRIVPRATMRFRTS